MMIRKGVSFDLKARGFQLAEETIWMTDAGHGVDLLALEVLQRTLHAVLTKIGQPGTAKAHFDAIPGITAVVDHKVHLIETLDGLSQGTCRQQVAITKSA